MAEECEMVTMDFDQPTRTPVDPVVAWMLEVRDYYIGGPIVPSGDHTYDPEAVDSYIMDILDEMLADRVGVIGGRPSRYGRTEAAVALAAPQWDGPPGTEPEEYLGDPPRGGAVPEHLEDSPGDDPRMCPACENTHRPSDGHGPSLPIGDLPVIPPGSPGPSPG